MTQSSGITHPRIGIIGLGNMGRTHLTSYRAAGANVVAALDPTGGGGAAGNLGMNTTPLDLSGVRIFHDEAEFFAQAGVDAVSICTPTDTHVAVAERALARGMHVLVEKPVALASADIRKLDQAAKASGKHCIPAMVMRFWPGWPWLRDRIRDQRFGPLRTLTLERIGSRPTWNAAFYADEKRSGGAMVDLHIHDADFVYWCFGKPDSLASSGSSNHVTTIYRVGGPAGPSVVATGGWAQHPSFGFRMRYLANFERATVEFDLSKAPNTVTLSDENGSNPVDVGTTGPYEVEVRHFLAVLAGAEAPRALLEDAAMVADILALERKSLEIRGCGRWS
jgi:predicted dehydrogenase